MKSDVLTPESVLDQLSRNSTPYLDPLARINWQALDMDSFWLPEQALSLYGVPEFMNCPREQRIKLSQYEFINLLEMNLCLETALMSRLCDSLHAQTLRHPLASYRLHELREEAGHSLMFLQLIKQSRLERVTWKARQSGVFSWLRKHAALDSPLYWALTLMVEELPDRIHRQLLRDEHMLCPVIVDLTRIHVIDESRHITHANQTLATIMTGLNRWQKATLRWILQRLANQFIRSCYFPGTEVYDLAGLMPGRSWANLAWGNRHRHQWIRQQLATTLRPLKDNGVVLRWTK